MFGVCIVEERIFRYWCINTAVLSLYRNGKEKRTPKQKLFFSYFCNFFIFCIWWILPVFIWVALVFASKIHHYPQTLNQNMKGSFYLLYYFLSCISQGFYWFSFLMQITPKCSVLVVAKLLPLVWRLLIVIFLEYYIGIYSSSL